MEGIRNIRWPTLLAGAALGAGIAWAAQELSYANWQGCAVPLEQDALVIRADAKGDGRFNAPRSGNRRHRGVDIEAPVGTPVRAVLSGVVIARGMHRGLGRYLELEHRHGLHSLYAHLDTATVDVGQRLRQGTVIGTVGKTGNAKHPLIKPHLHLEITRDGKPIDPTSLGLQYVESVTPEEHARQTGGE